MNRRIDQKDPRVRAANRAEQELFAHYKLDRSVEHVEMNDPKIRVRVLEVGEGKPAVMVPGGVGEAWIFPPLMAHLQGLRTIAVNRPGGGMSDGIDHRQVDFRRLAVDTLSSVLDHFELERVPLIANSMGGLWSFWMALDRPERVSAVVQLGTPALILDTSAPFPMRLMSIPWLNRLLVNMMVPRTLDKARDLPTFLGHPHEVGASWPEEQAECAYHFPRLPNFKTSWLSLMEVVLTIAGSIPDLRMDEDELQRIQQPVMFIWGTGDPFGSLDSALRAQKAVPNSVLHEVGTGHLPWWDEPQRCGRLIQQFLSENVPAGA